MPMQNFRLTVPPIVVLVKYTKFVLLTLFISLIYCVEVIGADLFLWSENHKSAANIAILKLALSKAEPRYGKINLKTTKNFSYEQAFTELNKNVEGFDLIISALDIDRENALLPVYFTMERGLLGFRLCIISQSGRGQFNKVSKHNDLLKNSLAITLNPSWPDAKIMEFNQIPVVLLEKQSDRFNLVREDNSICYSRSIIEIDNEIRQHPELAVEDTFVMIYPQADILYFRKGAGKLAEAIQFGLEQAYQDGSFLEVFDSHYAEIKRHYSLYERKLLILQSPTLSEKGREAINRFGLFSFIKQPGN